MEDTTPEWERPGSDLFNAITRAQGSINEEEFETTRTEINDCVAALITEQLRLAKEEERERLDTLVSQGTRIVAMHAADAGIYCLLDGTGLEVGDEIILINAKKWDGHPHQ